MEHSLKTHKSKIVQIPGWEAPKISKDGNNEFDKNKRRQAEFNFSIIGVWGEHMKPGGDDSDYDFVPTSSNMSILCY